MDHGIDNKGGRISEKGAGPDHALRVLWLILLAVAVLILLPHGVRGLVWVTQVFQEPPPAPIDSHFLRLFVWTAAAGLVVGIAIRLARKI